ncbi:hypothetical protein LTR91_014667 [Friedmanniomyces endolithicus]|uniref:Zn(2)-C6 fungal-type domain-containing protein n=1 Tax=Friedmanniomyces endolithicus TaxID=329885 RepID=A0AAN6KB96_9PEZI|nr:hypothetical protein LTR35_016586 [Friedmanniomyces endolithicus]KAK0285385.1 hypothetical protein LTS00_011015 [Friedmanniomyces endolithicus]KAK0322541.1 hypothetical protein LTR82_006501 [Friedmanniomyces endolithicus]KAK0898672.1 hypothetical protein LTR57_021504 [Friedmanniomyces endolithicus]KAK0973725.1 hypothetical protein LTR91_014667 [Friedmanniomyces endolithicus]
MDPLQLPNNTSTTSPLQQTNHPSPVQIHGFDTTNLATPPQLPGKLSTSSSISKRQRAKQACEPCRLRKRRCNGDAPCDMCAQFEYKCYFEKHPRKRSKLVLGNEGANGTAGAHGNGMGGEVGGGGVGAGGEVVSPPPPPLTSVMGGGGVEVGREARGVHVVPGFENGASGITGIRPPPPPEPAKEDRTGLEDATKLRSLEANSGLAFARYLGLRLDPSSGPKLFTFGWNLGISTWSVPVSAPITEFVSWDQMFALAQLYFENVHPLYGFLDREWTMEQLGLRWARPEACRVPDHMLAGIAALGILWATEGEDGEGEGGGFLKRDLLPRLVDMAKRALEGTSIMQPPCLMDVQSWNLRSLFLRLTDHPHATWMATCTAMHLVEATGIHREQTPTTTTTLHDPTPDPAHDLEIRRRTFWIARMLNTWFSFEHGRTRVALRGITCGLPTPSSREGDYTTDYINLYSVSCCLDPDRTNQVEQWEDFIRQLESLEARHDGIVLSKANLALCGYRRMRLAVPTLSSEILGRIISIGLKGLEAARRMAEQRKPWWHVANVPFQVICVFLAMDVRESLAHLATAMRTLEDVVERFKTVAMKEALKTARFLVRLSKKRKDEDSGVLGQSLRKVCEPCLDCDPQPENLQPGPVSSSEAPQLHVHHGNGVHGGVIVPPGEAIAPQVTPPGTTASDDWNLDILNDSNFDWHYFLESMPLVHMETNM